MPRSAPALSRRQWLATSGLGLGAGLALPAWLEAAVTGAPEARSTRDELLAMEQSATRARRLAGPIRLNFNENPFGMSPRAKAAIMDAWSEHPHYAPPSLMALREVFAKHVGVPADHVLVTQGSSEVLDVTAIAYGLQGAEVVTPWPTFEGFAGYAEALGATVHRVPLDASLAMDLGAMDARITGATKLVFVCNPNNPTGTLVETNRLRDFVRSAARRSVVLVDEAYHDFVDDPAYRSMTDLVLAGENVIVSRTASKIHGLAGLRIGFAIAKPSIIARMAQRVTGNPNTFGMRAAIASIADTEYQAFVKTRNREGRELLTRTLTGLGKRVVPSHTNFVFFQANRPVATVSRALEERGFLVGRAFPPYGDWVRVSIGTPEEMQRFAGDVGKAL
jgi:histidinol-phosphate aminotransferase